MKKFTSYKKVEISGFETIWDDFFEKRAAPEFQFIHAKAGSKTKIVG